MHEEHVGIWLALLVSLTAFSTDALQVWFEFRLR